MKKFELTQDLLTGVSEIDAHHRALLELGNRVCDPSATKKEGVNFEKDLSFLASYVIYHFAAEEYVMCETQYPSYDHHRQWHERFKSDISEYVNRGQKEGISNNLVLTVSFAIENWLLEHIRITDRALAKFLKERGAPVRLPDLRTLIEAGKFPEGMDEQSVRNIIS